MTHVTTKLARRLGGELDADEVRAVDEHLAVCADCRAEAASLRAVWTGLDAVTVPPPAGSVWLAVRSRTLGRRDRWFFGGGMLARSGLATAAVATGLALALLLPGDGGEPAIASVNDAGFWLSSTSWLDEGGASLQDVWLAWDAVEPEVES